MSSLPSPRRLHTQWNSHLYNLVSSLTNPSSPHCSLLKPQTHQYSRVRETGSPSLWIPKASATHLSPHYKPGPVLKIPLNCKPGTVLKIPEEQGHSHETHTYSFRILSATFVIKLVFRAGQERVYFVLQLSGHSSPLREARAEIWRGNWSRDQQDTSLFSPATQAHLLRLASHIMGWVSYIN